MMCHPRRILFALAALTALGGTISAQQTGADPLLNRFYGLKASNPTAARAALEEAARRFPNDIRVQLELGYLTLAAGEKPRALTAFRAAARLAPGRADLWRQIGYIENDLGNDIAALDAFERSRQMEPNDGVTLQIAYIQAKLERREAATRNFRSVIKSSDPKFAEQACGAYSNLRGLPDPIMPKPLFAEYYAAPEYRTNFGVTVVPFEARVGASFGETTIIEPYASARLTYDTRSGAGVFGPQIYFDNALVPALGVRVIPHVSIPAFVFVEGGAGYDIIDRRRERWRDDLRGGIVAYKEWNTALACPYKVTFPFRLIADVYADGVYYTRYQNFIAYVRVRPGLRIVETPDLAIDTYALIAATTDTKGLADNRQLETGGGVALRLYSLYNLTLRAEGVQVFRLRNSGYTDFRFRLEHTIRF
jgi:hypothetical protein